VKKLVGLLIFVFPVVCFSQTPVNLTIYHKLGASDFAYYLPSQNNMNGSFKLTRMEYYLSNFAIIHDGGQTISLPDTVIALVKAGQPTSVSLGNFNLTNIEGIKFYVGVPKNFNHNDPALQVNGSPLAYQAPSMHWGWISGYQFIALEGFTGAAMDQLTELHSFGDDNYFETTVLSSGLMYNGQYYINVNADYNRGLENIDISTGLIVHGDFLPANMLLENFHDYVFSPNNSLATISEISQLAVSIYPNPSNGKFTIETPATFDGSQLKVYSSNGQLIKSTSIKNGAQKTEIELKEKGSLLLEFYKDGNKLFSKNVLIQ